MSVSSVAEADLPTPLREQLERIEAIKRDAVELVDALTDTQLNWKPDATRWSVAQCLNHIVVTGSAYLPRFDGLIEEARNRERTGQSPYRVGVISSWFIRSMEPPPRFKAKTLRAMEPAAAFDGDTVLREFVSFHDELAKRIRAMRDIDPARARMSSPFFRPLRFTLGQAVALLVTHARRHLWQARQVRQHPAFPA